MFKTTGFTLVEVLVALVVLSGGLLGLAAMQATSLKNNQIAYNRGQATQMAYDIADRMRANMADVMLPNPGLIINPNSVYVTINPNAASTKPNCTDTIGCTAADMAENDLFEWNNAIATTLPDGTPAITVDAVTQIFTISIRWNENIDSNNDGIIDDNDRMTFQTSFQL